MVLTPYRISTLTAPRPPSRPWWHWFAMLLPTRFRARRMAEGGVWMLLFELDGAGRVVVVEEWE